MFEVLRRLEKVDEPAAVVTVLQRKSPELLELNREQLLEGKGRDGEDLTPSYFDDPFFKTQEAAARYSAWKDLITPNAKRKSGTPNLIIDGQWVHNVLRVGVDANKLTFAIDSPIGEKIFAKYGARVAGLNDASKLILKKDTAPELAKEIKKQIGLR